MQTVTVVMTAMVCHLQTQRVLTVQQADPVLLVVQAQVPVLPVVNSARRC